MTLGIGKVIQVNGEDRDVWIEFEVTNYTPGNAGDYWNPPESSEYEFNFISVEFDPKEEPVPEEIRNDIEDWFNTSAEAYHRAFEVAEDYYADSDYDDREYEYDDRFEDDDSYDDRWEYDSEDC